MSSPVVLITGALTGIGRATLPPSPAQKVEPPAAHRSETIRAQDTGPRADTGRTARPIQGTGAPRATKYCRAVSRFHSLC